MFQFGGAWSFVWGAKPIKAPRGDGTVQAHWQGRIKGGKRGQLPRAPRDESYLFKNIYSFEKFL